MGDYFQGRPRKVGVVTLGLALLLMAGWMRNNFLRDSVNIPTGNSSSLQFISGFDCLNLVAMWSSIPDNEMASFRVYRHEVNDGIGIHAGEIRLAGSSSPFRPKWPRLRSGSQNTTLMIFSIPYWTITLPLTLISIWLLLSSSRKSIQKELVEHIPEKVK